MWGWDNPDGAWLGHLFRSTPLSASLFILGPVDQTEHILLMVMTEPFQAFGNIKSVDMPLAEASHIAMHKSKGGEETTKSHSQSLWLQNGVGEGAITAPASGSQHLR